MPADSPAMAGGRNVSEPSNRDWDDDELNGAAGRDGEDERWLLARRESAPSDAQRDMDQDDDINMEMFGTQRDDADLDEVVRTRGELWRPCSPVAAPELAHCRRCHA